jgi:thymidylate kinase
MTAIDSALAMTTARSSEAPAADAAPRVADPAGELLTRVFEVLDRDGLAYCVTHAYADLPLRVESDVDMLVPREMLPRRLAELLRQNEAVMGARIVQWFGDRAHLLVLHANEKSADGHDVFLQLHVSCDFEVGDRVVVEGNEVLRDRRRFNGASAGARFWIPAPHVEFACVLANRIKKRGFAPSHTRQLASLWAADPSGCAAQLERLFRADNAREIAQAAARDDWSRVLDMLPTLRREMLARLTARDPLSVVWRWCDRQVRRMKHWCSPHGGVHIVFLGPDGVGKSTVIDAVRQRLTPAFLWTNYQSFARGILGYRKKASPHALPPRSLPASLLKAAWWLMCYTLGYYKSVYPTLARRGLFINHRYLLDAMVDPKRYRYSGPMKLLEMIWAVAPKPDMVVVLDAPAEIVHARKMETTLEETRRQREGYLAMARSLPNAHVVDTSQTPEKTADEVIAIVLRHTRAGAMRRLKLR